MCGRFTFFTDKELNEIDEIIEQVSQSVQSEQMKTGEIFPTNVAPVLLSENDLVIPRLMVWGFPNFRNKGVIINARSETVKEKKMFSSSLEKRRCIIPSTGFYEWDSAKKKYLFNMPDTGMLYMAGIYNQFDGEDRFVILTTEANSSVADVHDRMPVVLLKDRIHDWLSNINSIDYTLSDNQLMLIKRTV